MKKAKASRARSDRKRSSKRIHEKAALRSDAFARAIAKAVSYANDPDALRKLFEEAAKKASSIPREPFGENWPYLQTMLRFIRAYYCGEYRTVSEYELLSIIAALNYLIDPFDLIPDQVPFLGFVDDATVVEFAVSRARQALNDFMVWETTGSCRMRTSG
jgi:uncharacterized membrane protein YkvA (DUF1232 family)